MNESPSGGHSGELDTVRSRPGGRSARIRAAVLEATREELLERGYGALSHRAVAQRAGVDPATVYRRWPSRPGLATDALLEVAAQSVPVPDTGKLETDLQEFLELIVDALSEPGVLRLFHALSAASAEAQGDLGETLISFWSTRYAGAEEMIARAVKRGELPRGTDLHGTVEMLVAPAYFRALVTGEAMNPEFIRRSVCSTCAAAGLKPVSGRSRRKS